MSSRSVRLLFLSVLALAACRDASETGQFPEADRPVAPIINDSFSTEDARDRLGEAEEVIRLSGVTEGMSVADIGAGEGYYTVRLAPAVGRSGRVLAEDIIPATVNRLAQRVQRDSLDNVAVRLGEPDDPQLPANSFDRVFLVHMYHEVESPYAFLWHLREGLKPGGEIVVVDADRPIQRHGTPPDLLRCEFAAVGLKLDRIVPVTRGEAYMAEFRIAGQRPDPAAIKPCKAGALQS